MRMRHEWKKEDDIIALFLYKYGDSELPLTIKEICEKRGIQTSAMKMRIGNFKSLAGEGGLSHPSKQSKAVYNEYKNLPKESFKQLVIGILKK